jgi:hypothetical protein
MPRVLFLSSYEPFSAALRALGCEVVAIDPRPGRVEDAAALYAEHGPADLLLQREQLSGPILLKNLESLPCLTAFWSLDTHLNLWWHAPYARLFDLVLTTQPHLAEVLALAISGPAGLAAGNAEDKTKNIINKMDASLFNESGVASPSSTSSSHVSTPPLPSSSSPLHSSTAPCPSPDSYCPSSASLRPGSGSPCPGPKVAVLPWFGEKRRFTPHAARPQTVGFVGRVTAQRPARKRFLDLLSTACRATTADGLFGEDMLAFYDRTRLAPNESIFGEVNFRLFESASCGCLPLVQAVPGALDGLFDPDREIGVYADALELCDRIKDLAARPEEAEALARAAWERVRREHLPEHRARTLAEHCRGLTPRRFAGTDENPHHLSTAAVPGSEAVSTPAPQAAPGTSAAARAKFSLCLTALDLWLAGRIPFPPSALARDLAEAAGGPDPDPEALAGLLRLLTFADQHADAHTALDTALAHPRAATDPGLALAAGMAAIKLGRTPDSRALLERVTGRTEPEDPAHLLAAWAAWLFAQGRTLRPGFPYDPRRHLPGSAVDCLTAALFLAPGEQIFMRALAHILDGVRGAEHTRLGFLSALALSAPEDWRVHLDLGLCGLAVFRPAEGLADLSQAWDLALAQGQEEAFEAALAERDPEGRLKKALRARAGRDIPRTGDSGPDAS